MVQSLQGHTGAKRIRVLSFHIGGKSHQCNHFCSETLEEMAKHVLRHCPIFPLQSTELALLEIEKKEYLGTTQQTPEHSLVPK